MNNFCFFFFLIISTSVFLFHSIFFQLFLSNVYTNKYIIPFTFQLFHSFSSSLMTGFFFTHEYFVVQRFFFLQVKTCKRKFIIVEYFFCTCKHLYFSVYIWYSQSLWLLFDQAKKCYCRKKKGEKREV